MPAHIQTSLRTGAILLMLAGFLSPLPARAAAITNMSDQPQTIEVYQGGALKPVVIEAGRTYRVPGDLRVRVNGRDNYIDYYEEYGLWKNGDFGPQKATGDYFSQRFR